MAARLQRALAVAFVVSVASSLAVRVPQSRSSPNLQREANVRVAQVDDNVGMGVFAQEPIAAGSWICSYVGVLSTDDECDERYPPGTKTRERAFDDTASRIF